MEGCSLRVVTWNIRAGIGPGEPFPACWWRRIRRDRFEAIAAFIRGLDADVVVLQEVALGTVDGSTLDQPAELARLTGLEARYAALHHYTLVDPDRERAVGAVLWGNALLSRLPIVATTAQALPVPADDDLVEPGGVRYADAGMGPREARVALEASVSAGGRSIRVVGTHLAYVGHEQRRVQVDAVVGLAGPTDPLIVAGDLNAAVEDPELEPLRGALVDAFEATGTAPADPARESCGRQRIDHVFVRGFEPITCRVVREAGDLSDHWPVVAELQPP
ncbi:MAG TPA: endonuclease/exonuclease/phosphatase family protein [Candidatus Limnocylindrales bacterium]